MTRTHIIIAIVVVVVLVLILVLLKIRTKAKPKVIESSIDETSTEKVYEPCALSQISYTVSGDSLGSFFSISAKRTGDNVVQLKVKATEAHNVKPVEKEYILDESVLYRMYEIAVNHEMFSYGKLPMSDLQAVDEATVAISFRVNGKTVNTFSSQALPDDGSAAFEQVYIGLMKYTDGSITR